MADDTPLPEDLSSHFLVASNQRSKTGDVAEFEQFMRDAQNGDPAAQPSNPVAPADPAAPFREPKPLRRVTADPVGRLPPPDNAKANKAVSRNIAEVPGAAMAGVESAIHNAVGWAIDPLANWLNENVANLSYTRDQPQTPLGHITKSATEFLTGFIPALKGMKAVGLGTAAAPVAAGAIAGFLTTDPSAGRLSDLWKQAGLPQNILTDYLAHPPPSMSEQITGATVGKEGELEARFKNALEQAGFGTLTEGIIQGARMIRAARSVKGAKQSEEGYLKAKYGEIDDATFNKVVGDPTKPSVEMVVSKPPAISKKIAKGVADTAEVDPRTLVKAESDTASDVYINFSRFETPDDIKFAIGKMADINKGSIDEATRGVITQKETEKLADSLGMTVADLLERTKGTPLNAEQSVAARNLWTASGERVVALARAAAEPNAGPLDLFAFRKALATHSAIQNEVIGARTETARALASWNIPAKGGIERARAVDQVMAAMGGPEQASEMARRLAILGEVGADPAAIGRFAAKGAGATSMDALKEVWINGLLSSPKTHAVNVMSNTLVALSSIWERGAASAIRNVTGGDGVSALEPLAMTYGMINGVRDAFRTSARALKTGETSWTFNKVDLPQNHAISPEAFGMSQQTAMGRFVDFLGTATRVPTRLLGAEDEFFKTIGYRMEVHAQAVRQATSEGKTGYELGQRVAELVNNPPEHIMINAADAALYQTFTNEVGSFGKAMMSLRNGGDSLNPVTFVIPFVRTPVNIARYAFERTPFAPLVSQWRADISAGGARADLALARMSTGTMIMLAAMDYADKGVMTGAGFRGGKDTGTAEALDRQGVAPYSIRVGDKWYSYNRADPFGMTMGFAASIAEAVKKGEVSQDEVDEWQEVMAMSIMAVSQVAINKTYLEGLSKFMEVMADPKRYSQKYVDDLFASFLPMTSMSSTIKNINDPVGREVNTPADAVMARIAGLSKDLPPRRDLWGKEISIESGLGAGYDALSPIAAKRQLDSPIDKEMVRLDHGVERIQKQTNFDGVQTNMRFFPRAYDDYVRLAGNDLKHPAWGMGAKDMLNAVVSGQHPLSAAYNIMSDESRQNFIQSTIGDYRKLAQQQVLQDPKHANFAAEVARLKTIHQGARMPVMGATQ